MARRRRMFGRAEVRSKPKNICPAKRWGFFLRVFFKIFGDFAGNFGWFLGGMFVFGRILTVLFAQTRKFGEKVEKNAQKSDEKVRDFVFLFKKIRKYADFGH